MGVNVLVNQDTIDRFELKGLNVIKTEHSVKINCGKFQILPFNLKHDVPCFGFLIKHPESGTICFMTDSYYSPFKFKNITNWIIEANYCENILKEKGINYVSERVRSSHMSIQNCISLLKENDMSRVENIVLIHLSDSNSDEKSFKNQVAESTKQNVFIAEKGLIIPMNLPF